MIKNMHINIANFHCAILYINYVGLSFCYNKVLRPYLHNVLMVNTVHTFV